MYPDYNPSGFITGFNSGNFVVVGQTGQFYSVQNINNYATSGNLYSSGSYLLNLINVSSGVATATGTLTGNFYPLNDNPAGYLISSTLNTGSLYPSYNPSGFITGLNINTGNFIVTGQTGQFYSIQNNNNYATSGNLFNTGAGLQGEIVSLSGNLLGSGANLLNQINQINTNSGNFTNLFYPLNSNRRLI